LATTTTNPTAASKVATHVATPQKVARTKSLVQLNVLLPYQGQDNYWTINLQGANGSYEFTTSGDGALGYVEAGTYTAEFSLNHGYHSFFEFYVGCNQTSMSVSYEHGMVYNATIDDSCNTIIIDAEM
jgi:hypothetical protein